MSRCKQLFITCAAGAASLFLVACGNERAAGPATGTPAPSKAAGHQAQANHHEPAILISTAAPKAEQTHANSSAKNSTKQTATTAANKTTITKKKQTAPKQAAKRRTPPAPHALSPWWQQRYEGWLALYRSGASQAVLQQAWQNTQDTFQRVNSDRAAAGLQALKNTSPKFTEELSAFLQQQHGYAEQLAHIDQRLHQWGSKLARAMTSQEHNEQAWSIYQRGLDKQRQQLLLSLQQLRGKNDFTAWDQKYQRTAAINETTYTSFTRK